TKRYPPARVWRVLTYLLIHAVDTPFPDAVHVLGFSARGQAYLTQVKERVGLVPRIGKEPWASLTPQADLVSQLGADA
ncbi:nucleotidyltransferase family protein, partial [Streptococcus suis]